MSDCVTLPDGRQAQLWQGGAAAGATIFFMHGCPDCRLAARTGEAAARRTGVRLVAVNQPGYGRSDSHESGQVSVADDTLAVADVLGIEQFAVLGMSVGGIYAVACAALHPDRVTAMGWLPHRGSSPRWTLRRIVTISHPNGSTLSRSCPADCQPRWASSFDRRSQHT